MGVPSGVPDLAGSDEQNLWKPHVHIVVSDGERGASEETGKGSLEGAVLEEGVTANANALGQGE